MSNLLSDLLNVPNPAKIIKQIIDLAILSQEKDVEQANKDLDNLKQQQKSGVYSSPVDTNPTSVVKYVTVAVLTILGDMLQGFQSGIKHMEEKTNKIIADNNKLDGTQINNDIRQRGGSIIVQANVLNRLIGGANQQINELIGSNVASINNNGYVGGTIIGTGTSLVEDVIINAGTRAFEVIKNIGEYGLKKGIQLSDNAIDKTINYIMDATGERELLDTPIDKLSPELNKKVLLLAGVLKGVSTNPATKQAVKEIAEAIAITLIEVLKEIQPQVNKVTDQGTEMLEEVSEKVVTGVTGTGISIAQAFLAEIPMVGGFLDLFIAIGKGFNALMRTYKVFVEKGGDMVVTGAQAIKNTENTAMDGKDRVLGAVKKATDIISTATPTETPTETPVWVKRKDAQGKVSYTNRITNERRRVNVMPTDDGQGNPLKGEQGNQSNQEMTNKMVGGGTTRYNSSKIQMGGERLRKTLKLFQTPLSRLKYRANGNDGQPIRANRTRKKSR